MVKNTTIPETVTEGRERLQELYRNIEVMADYKYKFNNYDLIIKGTIKNIEGSYRYVFQGDFFYINIIRPEMTVGGETSYADSLQGYDGQETRVVEQRAYCNLIKGRHEELRLHILNPHSMPFRHPPLHVTCSLSTFLEGGARLRAQAGWFHDKNVKITFDGKSTLKDMACEKIRTVVSAVGYGGKIDERVHQEIWLAADRNYIPIRVEWYNLGDHPVVVYEVDRLNEIEPGIWFPSHTIMTTYNSTKGTDPSKVVNYDEFTIKKVSLNPNYGKSLFQDIPFPEELPIYVVENGKIVESIKPRKTFLGAKSAATTWLNWKYLLIGNVIVFVAWGLVILKKRNGRQFQVQKPR